MKTIIVERTLEQPMSRGEFEAQCEVARDCFEFYRVRLVRRLVSLDGLRVISEYQAVDAESVRQAIRKIPLPVERVWTASNPD